MAHLLALGHKRIGFVFGLTDPAQGADRIEPYHEAIAAAGLPADPALVAECGPALEDVVIKPLCACCKCRIGPRQSWRLTT